ncbi:sensor histidine kinase [Pimelobacter simplex]|uniref:sensor histidine kinase n=1 Tax=Nocardioides simplex TaxID=2045 RepID=UPI00366A7B69
MAVRTRTTLGAVLVVALALLAGAAALVLVVRGSLHDAAETTAEHRADDLAAQVAASGPPAASVAEQGDDDADDPDDPDDVVWQVLDPSGAVVSASQPLAGPLPAGDDDVVDLPGADHPYVVVNEEAEHGGTTYVVVAAVSLEDVDETTAALLTPLLVGLPVLLLVVGATTWLVVSRALGPVERIRREVEQITGTRLDRRVPEPSSRDEIGRLARTMNGMLGRLQDAARRQEEFVADASHELRSPLASLRQVAEVAQAHPGALDEGELATTVHEETVRMQALVDQLLVLTRAGAGREGAVRVDVDVDDLVLAEARRAARAGVAADTTAVGPGRVQGDPVALGQVVRNLVDNALRHAASRIALGVAEDGRHVVVTVDDDGPGIPAADRERVFERFVRLDDARARDAGGSGLGLAIVRALVVAHGGVVTAEDAPLGGARLVVRLPS